MLILSPRNSLSWFIISGNGVQVDPAKVQAVTYWPVPQDLHHVRQFLGFVQFYRRFIEGLSGIASPLTELTKKDTPFRWSPACQAAFQSLQDSLTSAPFSSYLPQILITPFMSEQMHLTLPLGVNSARIRAMAESSLHMKAGNSMLQRETTLPMTRRP